MSCVRFALACLMLVLTGVQDASADIPWLEKLSGPGPFWGAELEWRLRCRIARAFAKPDPDTQRRIETAFLHPFAPAAGLFSLARLKRDDALGALSAKEYAKELCRRDEHVTSYYALGFHYYNSTRNDLVAIDAYDEVSIFGGDFKYGARLNTALDLGAGLGVSVFKGPAFNTFPRMRVSLAELKFYPLALQDDDLKHRLFFVSAGAVVFVPGFGPRDFCGEREPRSRTERVVVPCAKDFREDPEIILRLGVNLDFSAIPAFRSRR
jgi:hypothetical protein